MKPKNNKDKSKIPRSADHPDGYYDPGNPGGDGPSGGGGDGKPIKMVNKLPLSKVNYTNMPITINIDKKE